MIVSFFFSVVTIGDVEDSTGRRRRSEVLDGIFSSPPHLLVVPDEGLPVDDPGEVEEVEDARQGGQDAQRAGLGQVAAPHQDVVPVGVLPGEAGHACFRATVARRGESVRQTNVGQNAMLGLLWDES